MTVIGEPKIDTRPEQQTMGIRIQTPMKGLSKAVEALFKELNEWARTQEVHPAGAPFLRFYVIDMGGMMDIEVGVPVSAPLREVGRIRAGRLPAGRYASLVYCGSGLAGNKALIDWARARGLSFDRWDDPKGDAFRARSETYLTDPEIEPRKTRWEIEVAIKLADG